MTTEIGREVSDNSEEYRYPSRLGAFIQAKRRQLGLSMTELAKGAGVDASQISRLERGHQRTAHASTLEALAQALDTDPRLLKVLSYQLAESPPLDFPDVEEVLGARTGEAAGMSVEEVILADRGIPEDKKEWLLDCVAVARSSA